MRKTVEAVYNLLQSEQPLHEIFQKRRMSLMFTQQDVAKELGCTPSLISQFESGRARLSIDKLQAYAAIVGFQIDVRVIEQARDASRIKISEAREIIGQMQSMMQAEAVPDLAEIGEQVARLLHRHELITPSDLVALGLDENVAPPMPPVTPANAG